MWQWGNSLWVQFDFDINISSTCHIPARKNTVHISQNLPHTQCNNIILAQKLRQCKTTKRVQPYDWVVCIRHDLFM